MPTFQSRRDRRLSRAPASVREALRGNVTNPSAPDEVPRLIASQRSGDRLLQRPYTDVAFETVLYAVPEVP